MRDQLEEFRLRASAWLLFRSAPQCGWTGCYHLKDWPYCRIEEYARAAVVQPAFSSRPYGPLLTSDVFRTEMCRQQGHGECESFICGCPCHD